MTKRSEIQSFLDWLKHYAENHNDISKVILFGSFALDQAQPHSDIDLAFWLTQRNTWSCNAQDIRNNSKTLRALDLVLYDDASQELKNQIQKEGLVIFERH